MCPSGRNQVPRSFCRWARRDEIGENPRMGPYMDWHARKRVSPGSPCGECRGHPRWASSVRLETWWVASPSRSSLPPSSPTHDFDPTMDIKKLLRSPSPAMDVTLDEMKNEDYGTNYSTMSINEPNAPSATSERHASSDSARTTLDVRDAPAKPVVPDQPDNILNSPVGHPPDEPALDSAERELTRRPTPAEKARENKLRADKLCEISSPQLVRCRRCNSWIKLSAKSAFDPAHWNKHRDRCIRRSETVVEELRETNSQQAPFPSDVKPPNAVKRMVAALATPPLTPDRDGDETSSADAANPPAKEDSPLTQFSDSTQASPPPSPTPVPAPPPAIRDPDPAFEEYLARSQRRPTRDLASPLLVNWQEWSWSQLKKPVWYPEHDDSDDEEEDDRRRRVPVSHARASAGADRSCESGAPCYARLLHDRRNAGAAAGAMGGSAVPGRLS
ncbi:uncharacterized protein B0H18DRAFT_147780 [Fomitopsis serialis]|uniref:uncharacterized protein n=1 Tax=Fomitopsis serialis TaxID=139415 RepID=UPI00200866A0|nr:uncharacterized protein B0H18DRAFT_147780 [Neoantrodia serialis]KAH9930327.1 hypothetical protein B0H18DRAFT_147780 [Neoantrodia serialis]